MTAVPDEGASQLKQAQVIGGLLVVAHQYPPALGEPTQGAFHHPPSGGNGMVILAPSVQLLLPNAPDMRTDYRKAATVPMAGGTLSYPLPRHRFWVPSGPATTMLSKRRPQEFRVMDGILAPATDHAQGWPGNAASTDWKRCSLLAPSFAPVGGVASIWRPPPTAALPMEQSADCHSQSTQNCVIQLLSILRSGQPRCPPAPHLPPSAFPGSGIRWMVLSSPNLPGQVVSTGNRCASER